MLKVFKAYLAVYRTQLLTSAVCGVLAGATSVQLMALVSIQLSSHPKDWTYLLWVFPALLLLNLASNVGSALSSLQVQQQIRFEQSLSLCKTIVGAPLAELEKAGEERLLTTLTSDILNINDAVLQLPPMSLNISILVGCLGYLAWQSWAVFWVVAGTLALAVASYSIPEKRAKRLMALSSKQSEVLAGHFQSLIRGAKELRLHGGRRTAFLDGTVTSAADILRRRNVATSTIYAFLNAWSHLVYFVLIGLIVLAMAATKGLDKSVMTTYALTILYIRGPLMFIVGTLQIYAKARVSLERIQQLGKELATRESACAQPSGEAGSHDWSCLELTGVTHSYHDENETRGFVLGPIDLTLHSGQIVFFCGGNGSGKTTLGKLITCLYAAETGELRMDGNRIGDHNRDCYRQYFSAVFCEYHLFDPFLGLKAGDPQRAQYYLEKLHLKRVVQIANGRVSSTKLSSGQRKRLALLNAYLEDRPIYFFDEWASGQDPTFKEVFYVTLLPELKARGKTVLVISHDDRYYHVADRLIKLESGKIVFDTGSPVEQAVSAATFQGERVLPN